MTDDKTETGETDRSLVNASEVYEVTSWRNNFDCTEEMLKLAFENVGQGNPRGIRGCPIEKSWLQEIKGL